MSCRSQEKHELPLAHTKPVLGSFRAVVWLLWLYLLWSSGKLVVPINYFVTLRNGASAICFATPTGSYSSQEHRWRWKTATHLEDLPAHVCEPVAESSCSSKSAGPEDLPVHCTGLWTNRWVFRHKFANQWKSLPAASRKLALYRDWVVNADQSMKNMDNRRSSEFKSSKILHDTYETSDPCVDRLRQFFLFSCLLFSFP